MNKFGLYDQSKNGTQLVNAFVKLELYKYKQHLDKSKSFYQLPNKRKMIFGGQVKLGVSNKDLKKENTQQNLLENMMNYYESKLSGGDKPPPNLSKGKRMRSVPITGKVSPSNELELLPD